MRKKMLAAIAVKETAVKLKARVTNKGFKGFVLPGCMGSDQSRIINTIENDNDTKNMNEAVEAVMQTCRQFGVQCKN